MSFVESGFSIPRPDVAAEIQLRERLSDRELGDLLSATGNHEAKALALGAMTRRINYDQYDLNQMMLRIQGSTIVWNIKGSGVSDYLVHSMSPVGLVNVKNSKAISFEKTEKGYELGEPLAGLLLDFSLRYPDFSLIDFFAGTQSKYNQDNDSERKKRAPDTRYAILKGLLTNRLPISLTDFTNIIKEDSDMVGVHLSYLNEKNIISYRTVGQGEGKIYTYNPNADGLSIEGENRKLENYVLNLLSSNPEGMSIGMIVDEYLSMPDNKEHNRISVDTGIRKIISEFKKIGAINMPNGSSRSSIDLNHEQAEMIFDLIYNLEEFKKLDKAILNEWRVRLIEILSDPILVSRLLKKSKEHSPFARKISHELTLQELKTLITKNPGLSSRQLRKLLEEKQGRLLSKSTVDSFIRELREQYDIEVGDVNGIQIYSVLS